MEEPRKRFSAKRVIGCIAVPLLGIFALCGGPDVYFYFYKRSVINEFRSNRAFYEGLVRQIQADNIPKDRSGFYILPENRYPLGAMLKLEPGIHERWLIAVFDGMSVRVENWSGVLRIYFGMRVKGFPGFPPLQYGVMYYAGNTAQPGAEESLEKFDDRWWQYSWFLGH